MRKAIVLAVVVGVSTAASSDVFAARDALEAPQRLIATMTPAQVVTPGGTPWRVPAAAAKARGSFTGTVSADGRTLSWRLSYSNLGRTSTVIADIHLGKPGRFGPILVRLCTGCRSGQTGVKRLKKDDAGQFRVGNTWVTLITDKYPNGIVRGQIRLRTT